MILHIPVCFLAPSGIVRVTLLAVFFYLGKLSDQDLSRVTWKYVTFVQHRKVTTWGSQRNHMKTQTETVTSTNKITVGRTLKSRRGLSVSDFSLFCSSLQHLLQKTELYSGIEIKLKYFVLSYRNDMLLTFDWLVCSFENRMSVCTIWIHSFWLPALVWDSSDVLMASADFLSCNGYQAHSTLPFYNVTSSLPSLSPSLAFPFLFV